MCRADEVDPLCRPSALNELVGDALLHHLLHVVSVVRRAKLDVVVHVCQADVFILLKTHKFRANIWSEHF